MSASAATQLSARDHFLARLAHAIQQERVLIPLAFGVVGLHLADDSFLQLEAWEAASTSAQRR